MHAKENLGCPSPKFSLDSEINTRAYNGYGRDLIPWDASLEDGQVLDEVIDEPTKAKSFEGNQFLLNQELFGVVSTYKDDLSQYTTPLDISAVPAAIQEKAARLAREIERKRKNSFDPEDAGMDNDEDEEGLWSAVPRGDTVLKSKNCESQGIRDADSKPISRERTESTKTCESHGAETPVPAPTVRGTFVHIDGVGLVDEWTAHKLEWNQQHGNNSQQQPQQQQSWQYHQQQSWQQPPQACTMVGQWHGTQVLTTVQVSSGVAAVATTQPHVLPSGTEVVIEGLVKAPAFNGLHGIVDSFDRESGRYNVRLQSGTEENQMAKIKIENLRWVMLAGQPLTGYQ